jgi:hypothetical protein
MHFFCLNNYVSKKDQSWCVTFVNMFSFEDSCVLGCDTYSLDT